MNPERDIRGDEVSKKWFILPGKGEASKGGMNNNARGEGSYINGGEGVSYGAKNFRRPFHYLYCEKIKDDPRREDKYVFPVITAKQDRWPNAGMICNGGGSCPHHIYIKNDNHNKNYNQLSLELG